MKNRKMDKRLKFFKEEQDMIERNLKMGENPALLARLAIVTRSILALENDLIPVWATTSDIINAVTESLTEE